MRMNQVCDEVKKQIKRGIQHLIRTHQERNKVKKGGEQQVDISFH